MGQGLKKLKYVFYSLMFVFGCTSGYGQPWECAEWYSLGLTNDILKVCSQNQHFETMKFMNEPICNTEDYRLVFSDEFEGTEVDESNWQIINGQPREGNTLECYAAEQLTLETDGDNNYLRMFAEIDPSSECYLWYNQTNAPRTMKSGEIQSRFRFGYGYYEARVQLPNLFEGSFWPSFWIYGEEPWTPHRHVTEIDIFEFWSNQGFNWHTTTHTGNRECGCYSELYVCAEPINLNSCASLFNFYQATTGGYSNQWFVFGLEYTPYVVRWFLNGQLFRETPRYYKEPIPLVRFGLDCDDIEVDEWIKETKYDRYPSHPGNVIFSLGVRNSGWEQPSFGDGFPAAGGGPLSASGGELSDDMKIDYFRYYKRIGCKSGMTINEFVDLEIDNGYNALHGDWFHIGGNVNIQNWQIEIVAGEEITLLPGFKADQYSNVELLVKSGLCEGSGMMSNETNQAIAVNQAKNLASNVVAVEDEKINNWGLSIYPNPVSDQFSLGLSGNNAESMEFFRGKVLSFKLYDTFGSIVRNGTLALDNDIVDVQGFARGVYYFTLEMEDRVIFSKPLLLE